MDLLADRFIVSSPDRGIDLASGDAVTIVTSSAGGATDERRWAVRCDAWRSLRHPWIAQLVDYGGFGEGRRFEAWRCGGGWNGAAQIAEHAKAVVHRFLRASGLTCGDELHVRRWQGSAVVMPDSGDGHSASIEDEKDLAIEERGLFLIPRAETAPLAELFEAAARAVPRVASLWGARGIGKSTMVEELARIARVNGFVPIASRLWSAGFDALVTGRSLFVIDDGNGDGGRVLLDATVRDPRGHVLLHVGDEDVRGVDGLSLGRVSESALVDAVRPRASRDDARKRLLGCAERSNGVPGRFAQYLWPSLTQAVARRDHAPPRHRSAAAERQPLYGSDVDDERAPGVLEPRDRVEWPAPGELAALRRRLEDARRSIEAGRHAAGERALRQSTAMLARRADWTHACDGAAALASCLLARGRARDALSVIEDCRQYAAHSGQPEAADRAAVLAGAAWIDLGRLEEGESVLQAAIVPAPAGDPPRKAAEPLLVLARCLFWRGRYVDAQAAVDRLADDASSDQLRIRAAVQASRAAVGLGDLPRALEIALAAGDRARAHEDPRLLAEAACGIAFARLASGDLDGVDRSAAECVAAARAAHDPLQALRGRLLAAEGARRRGRLGPAERLVRRMTVFGAARLPPLIAARGALLKDLAGKSEAGAAAVARHVTATGLPALALFAPASDRPDAIDRGRTNLGGLIEILRVCQTADDERTVLAEICRRLTRELRAAAVAFVVRERASLVTIAVEGRRIETAVAERAIDAGIPIAPHQREGRIDAAVPIRYGGSIIGALAARWALGCSSDAVAAPDALAMAATAAAPILAAAVAGRASLVSVPLLEIVGTSTAIEDVRRAIDRAARAPFPVLVEGESGVGKELVARALHRASPRRDRSFCAMNCAALPDDLVETELFGHARGAFTGAVSDRPGVFEEAHGGTLFLDEIGELSARAQAKVLRVIQEGDLRRVGETVSRRVDVRIVAATNRDLRAEAAASRFRIDLLYRLDVIRIVVPPLRDRREDIAALAERFWRESATRVGSRATLAAATIAALARYDWPGNVRELQNVLASLAVRSPRRGIVPPTALPPMFAGSRDADTWRLDAARRTFEEGFVRAALSRAGGRRGRAALELGVSRQGLTKIMNRLGIS